MSFIKLVRDAVDAYLATVETFEKPIGDVFPMKPVVQWYIREQRWDDFVKAASFSLEVHDTLLEWGAQEIECGRALPPEVAAHIADYLRGKILPPKKRRANDPAHSLWTDMHIEQAIRVAVEACPQMTLRSDDDPSRAKKTPVTIFDIVVAAFEKKGFKKKGARVTRAVVRDVYDRACQRGAF